jgi:xylan 1,4-beta-xylosidase
MGIEYWEIWNEPDLYGECWVGTPEQYFELYAITSKRLKERFPYLKIGGPAVTSFNESWLRRFLAYVRDYNIPLDFYSWHCYASSVDGIISNARRLRALLDEYGFTEVESLLNEWNYVRGWSDENWLTTIETITSLKGATFAAAVMAACQHEPVDMLMYYDARPTGMNGMFSQYTFKPMKTYYPVAAWSDMADLGTSCKVSCDIPDIYAATAKGESGNRMIFISYYTDSGNALPKTFAVDVAGSNDDTYRISVLDEEHNFEDTAMIYADNGRFTLTMKPNTAVILR